MNIAFFVTGLDSGGIENYLLRFLQYKAASFGEIIVFCKGGKAGQLKDEYCKIKNVTVVEQSLSYFNPFSYLELVAYLKKYNFDTVCDFTGNFAGLVMWSAKLAGIRKRVSFYRGSTNHFKGSKFKLVYNEFVKKMTYRYATDILSNSQAALDFFYRKKYHDKRFKVIYNGIDTSKFNVGNQNLRHELDIPENSFVIGHTGRFNYAKNHTTILKVAQTLIQNYSDIYFILCGNGVVNGLQNVIKELGIEEKVRLFNYRNDVPVFLNTMNVYFFPSVTEGQPNALIEAMVMGLPFVSSDIEPIKETVEDYTNLFNPFDIKGFASALAKLYVDGKERDYTLKETTSRKFDHKKRFDEFYNILI